MNPAHIIKVASETAVVALPEVVKTTHYVDIGVAAVVGVAGLIIGFFVHAIVFWIKAYSVFVTNATCQGNKQACERLSDVADGTVKDQLAEHGKQLDEIFRFNREIYGMVLALVAKLKVAPVEQEDFSELRDLNESDSCPKSKRSGYACNFADRRRHYENEESKKSEEKE